MLTPEIFYESVNDGLTEGLLGNGAINILTADNTLELPLYRGLLDLQLVECFDGGIDFGLRSLGGFKSPDRAALGFDSQQQIGQVMPERFLGGSGHWRCGEAV
ncbi:hypothetical protein Q3G72_021570 [Acer saccharum]|nr:hypothetical protein Q3G72_021570 [Acer saccharum]